jgi:cytochrome c oxidase accessory protein FixG
MSPQISPSEKDKPRQVPMPAAILEALRLGENETASTIGQGGSRVWLYPREIVGRFTQWRTAVALFLTVVYLGFPWLRWRGEPLLRVDVFDRKLVMLGHDFFPQDIRLFLPGIIGFILVVFLVTATWGRIWCGWACPQTVFLQFIFGPIERFIEGRAAIRQKRDTAPISFDWIWRKTTKHAVFALVALLISNTALAYFWGTDGVIYAMTHSPTQNWTGFSLVAVFAAVFYWVFAYFREQACVIVCPYARFQSVLIDEKSMVVAYDAKRGEKRGRGVKREGLGDCVDCKQCVLVCPTGIDIRQGNQLECIGCTRCIDACDRTMTANKKPTGLIRYASLLDLQGQSNARKRVRPVVYGVLATLLFGACGYLLYTRPHLAVDILRRGNEPYLHAGADSVLNTFTLHIRNKDIARQVVKVRFADETQGRLNWDSRSFTLGRGEIKTLPLDIVVPRHAFHLGKRDIALEFTGVGTQRIVKTTLVGPYGN